jgi:hypothetical protein
MTTVASSNTALAAAQGSQLTTARRGPGDAPLTAPARELADAARAFRDAALDPREPTDVTLAFAHLEGVLDELAAAAELTAYATIDAATPAGASMAQPAPPRARAISWRLHGLSSNLLAARATCGEVNRALHGAGSR